MVLVELLVTDPRTSCPRSCLRLGWEPGEVRFCPVNGPPGRPLLSHLQGFSGPKFQRPHLVEPTMADSLAGAAALSAPLTPSQPWPARSMRFACDSPGAAPQGLPGAFWSRGQLEELSFCMWRHRGL